MKSKLRAILAGSLMVLLSGCFDIEQGVTLNRDYAGTATLNFKIDMEPMVVIMAAMEKSFAGDDSPPTAQEIEAARAEFLDQKDADEQMTFEREETEDKLPEGVRLVMFEPIDEGLRFGARMVLEFDHFSKLQQIDFRDSDEAGASQGGPEAPAMIEQPFAGLRFTDEGDSMLVTSPVENPLEGLEEDNPAETQDMGEWEEVVTRSFESLRVATSLTLPFEVLEHNATRVDGDTLWWEYDLQTLKTQTAEQLSQGIRVRFKK